MPWCQGARIGPCVRPLPSVMTSHIYIENCCRRHLYEPAAIEMAYLSQNSFDLHILGFEMTLDLE